MAIALMIAVIAVIAVIALLAPFRAHAQAALAGTSARVCLLRAAPSMAAQQVLRGSVGMSCAPEQHRLGRGDDGGDEVLRVFARTLRGVVPVRALVARIGGEEFAIVTAASDPVDAETLLARLRLARMPFDLAVTASAGTCTGSLVTGQDWTRLYRCADRALFDAKSAGRDQSRRGIPLAQAA